MSDQTAIPQVPFELGEFGVVTATTRRGDHTAAVIYTVISTRVHGAFTIRPDKPLMSPALAGLAVSYGVFDPIRPPIRWADRPVVNAVTLLGTNLVAVAEVPTLATTGRLHPQRDARNVYGVDAAPAGVSAHTSAVVAAIATAFLARDDLGEVYRIACARSATEHLPEAFGEVESLDQRIRASHATRRHAVAYHEALQQIADADGAITDPVDLLVGI